MSGSRRCVTWRDVPGLRRSRSRWMSASASARPGGQPSTTQPIAGPCDSPNEVTQNSVPSVLPDMRSTVTSTCGEFSMRDALAHAIVACDTRSDRRCKSTASIASRSARRAQLAGAQFVAVLTGAGVSAESGVPTFRDAQTGLVGAVRSARARHAGGVRAQPEARLGLVRVAARAGRARRSPMPASRARGDRSARARFPARSRKTSTACISARAAAASSSCTATSRACKCSREGAIVAAWDEPRDEVPPRCAACGAFLRPDVVWFEETAARGCARGRRGRGAALRRAARRRHVGRGLSRRPRCPTTRAQRGALRRRDQPTDAAHADADYVLRGPAGVVLPALVRAAWSGRLALLS